MPELPTDDVSEWTNAIGPNGIPRINITAPVSASPSLPLENQTNYIVEPDLIEAQQGKVTLPPDVALNDAGIPFNKTTGKEIPVVRRPNVLPIAQKDESGNTIFAMPKMLDIFGSIMSPLAAPAVATKAGEVVLGSGAVRTMPEAVYPLAKPAERWTNTLGQNDNLLQTMTPDEFLNSSRPLKIDAESRETIDSLKQHILEGKPLDPLELHANGKEDGRHRAIAAKELGIDQVPVLNFRQPAGPFFSTLAQVVDNARLTKGDASQWLGYLKNQPGVKAEEVGQVLGELPSGQITKDQLQGIVQNNAVKLNEVVKGQSNVYIPQYSDTLARSLEPFKDLPIYDLSDISAAIKHNPHFKETVKGKSPQEVLTALDEARELPNFDNIAGKTFDTRQEAETAIAQANAERHLNIKEQNQYSDTKYHDYQLPGGENYKEMLLTLPDSRAAGPKTFADWALQNNLKDGPEARAAYSKWLETNQDVVAGNNYKSSHWDEPNIVAHVRYNDRNVEGAKTLHLEEVQSDWHQAGRKQGYIQKDLPALKQNADTVDQKLMDAKAEDIMSNPDLNAGLKDAVNRKIITQKEADDYLRLTQNEHSTIPDAPFKKNWDELALKRMLHKAATEGYDALSWTPGEAQAARYDLSKQVKGIHWQPSPADKNASLVQINPTSGDALKLQVDKTGKVVAGFPTSRTHQFEGKNLADVVGKEHAEKILEKQKGSLEGEGLKIGGEGMKSFYDKMLVDKANALAKKYGAKVEMNKPLGYKLINKYGVESKGGPTLDHAQMELDYKEIMKNTRLDSAAKADDPQWRIVPDNPIHFLRLTPELRQKAAQGFPLFSSVPVLNPVDFDPFQSKQNYKLVPIAGNPFQ